MHGSVKHPWSEKKNLRVEEEKKTEEEPLLSLGRTATTSSSEYHPDIAEHREQQRLGDRSELTGRRIEQQLAQGLADGRRTALGAVPHPHRVPLLEEVLCEAPPEEAHAQEKT